MKVTKKRFSEINEALNYLKTKEVPCWYGVSKNSNKMESQLTLNEKDRKAIFEMLAEKNEDGTLKVKVVNDIEVLDFSSKETETECLNALEVWSNEEIEFEFHHIKISSLENESLPASLMMVLEGYILVE